MDQPIRNTGREAPLVRPPHHQPDLGVSRRRACHGCLDNHVERRAFLVAGHVEVVAVGGSRPGVSPRIGERSKDSRGLSGWDCGSCVVPILLTDGEGYVRHRGRYRVWRRSGSSSWRLEGAVNSGRGSRTFGHGNDGLLRRAWRNRTICPYARRSDVPKGGQHKAGVRGTATNRANTGLQTHGRNMAAMSSKFKGARSTCPGHYSSMGGYLGRIVTCPKTRSERSAKDEGVAPDAESATYPNSLSVS